MSVARRYTEMIEPRINGVTVIARPRAGLFSCVFEQRTDTNRHIID
jgi:hypothetical protein